MRLRLIAAAAITAIGLTACGGGGDGEGVDFSGELSTDDLVGELRNRESFKESERLWVEWYEDCLITDTYCLEHFWEGFEVYLSGCILFHDPAACIYKLDVIAQDHGWSIPDYDGGGVALGWDLSYQEFMIDCLSGLPANACAAFPLASMEARFEACVDVWDEDSCLETLSVVKARADNYAREVLDTNY